MDLEFIQIVENSTDLINSAVQRKNLKYDLYCVKLIIELQSGF